MKYTAFVLFTVASLGLALPASSKEAAPPPAAGSSATDSADALWTKVETAMKEGESPKKRPKSREEAIAQVKESISTIDKLAEEFIAKAPKDARRWKIRFFEAETAQVRSIVGLASKGEAKAILEEILKAADADKETKGEASAMQVVLGSQEIEEGKGNAGEWAKLAEAHLKDYPDAKMNQMIQGQISKMKTLADLKTKPLELKFTSVDGKEVDLSKMQGKVVLIDFWATWCGPCVGEVPNVVKTYEKLHGKGFEILGISLDQDKTKLEAFTKEHKMTWEQFFDGKGWKNEISTKFGINSIPAMWLVNKKGMVISTNARGGLEEQVEKALAE